MLKSTKDLFFSIVRYKAAWVSFLYASYEYGASLQHLTHCFLVPVAALDTMGISMLLRQVVSCRKQRKLAQEQVSMWELETSLLLCGDIAGDCSCCTAERGGFHWQ